MRLDKPVFYIAPAILSILLVMVYPLGEGIYIGLTDRLFTYDHYSFIGLQNYFDLCHDELFGLSLFNSLKLTAISVVGSLLLGLLLALLLNNDAKYIKVFRGLLFIPWVMPSMVTALIFRWVYNDFYGYANFVLVKYHIIQAPVNLLADQSLAWVGISMPMIWHHYPFVMVFFLATLQTIDKTLYEAAQIDGANRWQAFWTVTFPAMKPAIIIVTILEIIWNFCSFDLVYLLTHGGPFNSTLTLSVYIYQKAFEYKVLGMASAMSTIMFILLFSFTMLYFWTIRRNQVYEN
ncbi:carbohydrate ABC transporter permease [Syntrophomonas palmitatica]|uniref:carbohydrate ABC transporter permease n=1 Tax=Syntrophomonas palmitatica TaxID=402877 RepID=UPI000ABA8866|nr:sugar ABC transporter permease [Syntrophomonas palmitatica]